MVLILRPGKQKPMQAINDYGDYKQSYWKSFKKVERVSGYAKNEK